MEVEGGATYVCMYVIAVVDPDNNDTHRRKEKINKRGISIIFWW